MNLLNDDLKDKITIILNGKIWHNITVFNNFSIGFLSQLTFIFLKKTYSLDENIIVEQDLGDEIFYIVGGKVGLIHKRTFTYIRELKKQEYFGEIGFFSDSTRTCTVRSLDFTDVLTIKKENFLEIAADFPEAIVSSLTC